ncbi:MAG: carboxypeptidase regulatory-like domain-containing protein, partial [Ilumatobacter sp.]|nr:carboxypeptidase regulatory-like domain-containing protein [Ilumatobacter sp.]
FLESAATGQIEASGDVTITLTGGPDVERTIRSFSGTGPLAGTYRFDRLPSPGAYTLTFSGGGAIPQVRVVDLDPASGGSTATLGAVELRLEERRVEGTVTEVGAGGVAGATVTLSDGAQSRVLISADDPLGSFAFDDVPPGAYTLRAERAGAFATIVPIAVEPGVPIAPVTLRLAKQASLSGRIVTGVPCDVVVRLYPFGQFDSQPVASVVPTNGNYQFLAVDAPVGYLVAVYTPSATEPLATTSVTSTPSDDVTVPTIDVSASCRALGS